jgi:uncharacterized protein (TIGR02646 family)
MIREYKHKSAPASLVAQIKYDGQDVLDQLFADQHDKCYLCEMKVKQFYQVEHLKSQEHFEELKFNWTNLLLSDGYCNGKKKENFDDILNPNQVNIEDVIEQRIDSINRTALFVSSDTSIPTQQTIKLHNRIFNGTYSPKLRKKREEEFYKEVEQKFNAFNKIVLDYLTNPNLQTENAVREELAIDKELLGFKYWVIKDTPKLLAVFANDIIWNK